MIVRVGCINVDRLKSRLKQCYLLNVLRTLPLDNIAASKARISDIRNLAPTVGYYAIYASLTRPGIESEVAVLFGKGRVLG